MSLSKTICLVILPSLTFAAPGPDTTARTGEPAVLAVYKKMEEADRKGDGQLWFSLRDRKTLATMNAALKAAILKGGRARPEVQYNALAVRVKDNRAIILGTVSDPAAKTVQYDAVLLVVEDTDWKVAQEQWSDKPFDRFALYALLPPDDGAFLKEGSPWKRIPYAAINTDFMKKDDVVWKVQATADDTFLYLRLESVASLPAPGSKVRPDAARAGKTGGPPPPPPVRIRFTNTSADPAAPEHEYHLNVSDLLSTSGALDGRGKSSPVSTVNYSFFIKNANGDEVFQTTLGDDSVSSLMAVQGRAIEIKLPLSGLGVETQAKPKITIEEDDGVVRFLPYTVAVFGRE